MDVGIASLESTLHRLKWAFALRYLYGMEVSLSLTSNGVVAYRLYCSAAGMAGSVWDYALTVGDEIKYFWRSEPWTFHRILFLGSRYAALLGSMSIGISE